MHKTRLRVLAFVVGLAFAAFGAVSLASLPAWPVVGVAVAAAWLVVNTVTARLTHPTCWGCGGDISGRPSGTYGGACPRCGSLNQGEPVVAESAAADDESADA